MVYRKGDDMKKGFTLAEVLITLGIIGVVAAMTLPALVQNYQAKVLSTQLKKQYGIITNIMQKMNYDLGGFKVTDFSYHTFAPMFKKYLINTRDCGNVNCEDMGHTNEETGMVRVSNNYKTYTNNDLQNIRFDDGQVIISDGALFLIENEQNILIFVSVDVNGIKKRPNRWGQDLFTFQIFDNGKVLPMGHPDTRYNSIDYCSTTSTSSINGIGCTYWALTKKDFFKNLPK